MKGRSGRIEALSAIILLSSGCSLILDPQVPADNVGTLAKYGEKCASDSACESSMCRTKRCSQACSPSAACPSSSECVSGVCEFKSPPALDTISVGELYVGPVGDHGWTLTHEEGRMYFTNGASTGLSYVSSHFAPSVATADAASKIDEFIAGGDNVIIATSFDFLVPMLNKSANYPDVNFLLCSGFQTGPNLGSYFAHMEQTVYMAGYLAAKVSRTKKLGLVGPVTIPETVRHINAFTRGARDARPDITVMVRWVGDWFNPPVETDATNELVDHGADVIFGQTDTTIPLEVSKTRTTTNTGSAATDGLPVYSIGYDNKDSCTRFAPDRCLASAYYYWGPMVKKILEQMHDGSWDPRTPIFDQMASDPAQSTVYLSPINETLVPSGIRLEVEGLVDNMTMPTGESKYYPFRPPVKDNTGGTRYNGQLPTDTDLISMCWFIEGVYDLDGRPAVVPSGCVGQR